MQSYAPVPPPVMTATRPLILNKLDAFKVIIISVGNMADVESRVEVGNFRYSLGTVISYPSLRHNLSMKL